MSEVYFEVRVTDKGGTEIHSCGTLEEIYDIVAGAVIGSTQAVADGNRVGGPLERVYGAESAYVQHIEKMLRLSEEKRRRLGKEKVRRWHTVYRGQKGRRGGSLHKLQKLHD